MLPAAGRPDTLRDSTAIVFVGARGSGRSMAIRLMRPWLRQWAYSSRHLTIANVVGKGYVKGAFSDDEWDRTYSKYLDETRKDPLYYVKRLLHCVTERDAHPTVMMISDVHTDDEVAYLKSVVGQVIVLGIHRIAEDSSTPKTPTITTNIPTLTQPVPTLTHPWPCDTTPDILVPNHGHDEGAFESALRMAFVGHVLPRMRSYMTLEEVRAMVVASAFPKDDGSTYYDTYSLWSSPRALSSVMYAYASLLRLSDLHVDCVVAVSEKAVPLTSFLAHMLDCRNVLLLHHTRIREPTPFAVTWREGHSAVGDFAVGWPNHLTREGDRALLVDDILATGEKARRVVDLARERRVEVIMLCVLFQVGTGGALPEDVPVQRLIELEDDD